MTPREFVQHLRTLALDNGLEGWFQVLERPPGRRPDPELVRLSGWFNALDEQSKQNIKAIAREACQEVMFGTLAILDGVRTVDETEEEGVFHLSFLKNGLEYKITPIVSGPYLHDIFNERD